MDLKNDNPAIVGGTSRDNQHNGSTNKLVLCAIYWWGPTRLIGDNKHFVLHLDADRKPMQCTQHKFYVEVLWNATNCPCHAFWTSCNFQRLFKISPMYGILEQTNCEGSKTWITISRASQSKHGSNRCTRWTCAKALIAMVFIRNHESRRTQLHANFGWTLLKARDRKFPNLRGEGFKTHSCSLLTGLS